MKNIIATVLLSMVITVGGVGNSAAADQSPFAGDWEFKLSWEGNPACNAPMTKVKLVIDTRGRTAGAFRHEYQGRFFVTGAILESGAVENLIAKSVDGVHDGKFTGEFSKTNGKGRWRGGVCKGKWSAIRQSISTNTETASPQTIDNDSDSSETPSTETASPQTIETPESRLLKLKRLLDQGLISKDDAAEKRRAILKDL